MAKQIGMGGSVFVVVDDDTFEYPVSTWSLAETNDVQDVTDTGSGGWVARIAGVSSGELSFTAFWGSGAATLSTTFAIGTFITVECLIGSGGQFFTIAGIIASFTVTNPAKSPVEFQCTLQSDGAITFDEGT